MVRGADAVRVLAPRIYEGGGTSPQTGTGGSTNFGPHTVKINQLSVFYVLFLILFKMCVGRTPPAPVCALGHPPHKCGGQGVYPPAGLNCPLNSQFFGLPPAPASPLRGRGVGDSAQFFFVKTDTMLNYFRAERKELTSPRGDIIIILSMYGGPFAVVIFWRN